VCQGLRVHFGEAHHEECISWKSNEEGKIAKKKLLKLGKAHVPRSQSATLAQDREQLTNVLLRAPARPPRAPAGVVAES
jgi:hypothetical protein